VQRRRANLVRLVCAAEVRLIGAVVLAAERGAVVGESDEADQPDDREADDDPRGHEAPETDGEIGEHAECSIELHRDRRLRVGVQDPGCVGHEEHDPETEGEQSDPLGAEHRDPDRSCAGSCDVRVERRRLPTE
jgi:hypothetical protein